MQKALAAVAYFCGRAVVGSVSVSVAADFHAGSLRSPESDFGAASFGIHASGRPWYSFGSFDPSSGAVGAFAFGVGSTDSSAASQDFSTGDSIFWITDTAIAPRISTKTSTNATTIIRLPMEPPRVTRTPPSQRQVYRAGAPASSHCFDG